MRGWVVLFVGASAAIAAQAAAGAATWRAAQGTHHLRRPTHPRIFLQKLAILLGLKESTTTQKPPALPFERLDWKNGSEHIVISEQSVRVMETMEIIGNKSDSAIPLDPYKHPGRYNNFPRNSTYGSVRTSSSTYNLQTQEFASSPCNQSQVKGNLEVMSNSDFNQFSQNSKNQVPNDSSSQYDSLQPTNFFSAKRVIPPEPIGTSSLKNAVADQISKSSNDSQLVDYSISLNDSTVVIDANEGNSTETRRIASAKLKEPVEPNSPKTEKNSKPEGNLTDTSITTIKSVEIIDDAVNVKVDGNITDKSVSSNIPLDTTKNPLNNKPV